MRTATRHLATLKAQQKDDWDKVAPAWRKWEKIFEQGAGTVTSSLLTMAGVAEGQQVLDIATGIGEPAISAARLVGKSGQVVAIDQSVGMLEVARKRSERLDLRNVTFLELDTDEMDFGEARFNTSFDAALCRWGLMYMGDLTGTLTRVRHQLRPGGRFAAAVWATSPKVPLLSLPLAVIAQTLRLPPQLGDPSFNLANRHALAHAFGQAGFVKVHSELVTMTVSFTDAATYTRYLQAVTPGLATMFAPVPPNRQRCTWQALGEAARQRYGGSDGVLRIPGESICIAGENPLNII